MESFSRSDILTPSEVEAYCQAIEPSMAEELGSLRWLDKHDRIEKLTMQAIVQALSNREETVKEMLIAFDKLRVLVEDVILLELWRNVVFKKLMKENPQCSFSVHTILYHEATCINLIETVLYHPDAVETLADAVLDVCDYCFHSLNALLATGPPQKTSSTSSGWSGGGSSSRGSDGNSTNNFNTSDPDVLMSQAELIQFKVAFKALSCLRYIIEQLDNVAGEVIPRLVISTDTPMLLTAFIVERPWIRRQEGTGEEEEYNCDEQKWTAVQPQDRLIIGKIQAQAWLALYQLFMSQRVLSMYEITEFRKGQLMRLRPYLNEVTLDQIPILGQFQHWLESLAIGNIPPPPSKPPLILEMMSSIRPRLEAEFKKNKKKLMDIYRKEFVAPSRALMMQKAQRLSETYDFENFEAVLPPSKCAKCGQEAVKRCSRCKNEWYCGRQCQVEHWTKHKTVCDLIAQDS